MRSWCNSGTSYADPDAPTTIASKTLTYDNNGNLTALGTTTYSWNYRNRMTQSGSGLATSTYGYDDADMGNRIVGAMERRAMGPARHSSSQPSAGSTVLVSRLTPSLPLRNNKQLLTCGLGLKGRVVEANVEVASHLSSPYVNQFTNAR